MELPPKPWKDVEYPNPVVPSAEFPTEGLSVREEQGKINRNDCVDLFCNPLHIPQLTPFSMVNEQLAFNSWNSQVYMVNNNGCVCPPA